MKPKYNRPVKSNAAGSDLDHVMKIKFPKQKNVVV